jgi:hypothetical protein
MKLTDADIDEFTALARRERVELTHEEATAAATRLALLYLQLAMPTPKELAETRLAKPGGGASLKDGRKTNQEELA